MYKKIMLVFVVVSLSLVAMAQNKKVAVMETKAASGVTAFQSNVVRGAMESAVSKAKGYEGYDRATFDIIMKEQEFQRSGSVDDSQIKKLGQMAGVQYVLVTEASAQDGYFYILAKLLDVETGKYGQAYDALCGISPQNIRDACAGLGESLYKAKKVYKLSNNVPNKKVAVMVPKMLDGVTEFQSNMVRGTMEAAVSQAKGYEGYDRAAFDILMKEQNFQRSGAVDESQIKQLGQMAGVQYILVTEISTQEGYFSLIAKLLDVETGKYEQAYDEVCATLPDEIRDNCQELGAIMFTGKRPSLAKKIKRTIMPQQTVSQQVPVYVEDRPEHAVGYNNDYGEYNQNYNNYNQNYNNYNNYNQPYRPSAPRSQVGDMKVFPDGSKGVVFYTENGRGLVVSITEAKMKWNSGRRNEDIPYLNNASTNNRAFVYGEGNSNTQAICQYMGSNAAAANWCRLQGEGWYLPSSGELYFLMTTARKGSVLYSKLESYGAKLSGWYWTSSECNKSEAINISDGGSVDTEDKDEEARVRAVRAFYE